MDKFLNKFRIPASRAKWWDYSATGIYFITICSVDHNCYFGEIENKQMMLSEIGNLVQKEWDKSFVLRKELFCDAFVIMPNHIHAILRIENDGGLVETHGCASELKNDHLMMKTHSHASLQNRHFGIAYRPPKSISSFVAGFKSGVIVNARRICAGFGW
jgi:putative transposase